MIKQLYVRALAFLLRPVLAPIHDCLGVLRTRADGAAASLACLQVQATDASVSISMLSQTTEQQATAIEEMKPKPFPVAAGAARNGHAALHHATQRDVDALAANPIRFEADRFTYSQGGRHYVAGIDTDKDECSTAQQ